MSNIKLTFTAVSIASLTFLRSYLAGILPTLYVIALRPHGRPNLSRKIKIITELNIMIYNMGDTCDELGNVKLIIFKFLHK